MIKIIPPSWMKVCEEISDDEKLRLAPLMKSWPTLSVKMSDGSLFAADLLKIAWLEMHGKKRGIIIGRTIARWRKLRTYGEVAQLCNCGIMPSRKLEKLLAND